MTYAIGLDIGGTKIAAGVVDDSGKTASVSVVPSSSVSEESMYGRVKECIHKVLRSSGIPLNQIEGIGAGTPGMVDREQGIAVFSNNLPWRNFPLAERLKSDFGKRIILENDVCMAAYAEWVHGGADEQETFVFLTVSTGIACSIIHQGDFFRGAGMAGEIGMNIEQEEHVDGAIVRRTLEELASGSAISQTVAEFTKSKAQQELFDSLLAGAKSIETINMIRRLARAVYSIICTIDPHRIVMGGGVINRNRRLLEEICKCVDEYRSLRKEPLSNRISSSMLKEAAGVQGAGLKLLHTLQAD
ncbi:ROK family protein [Bacillus sp. FJAT-42376]|uniref:ROK family protein n=1 Tax=Bacillus sp. FJAT-42376 TaxID=2014076 RepID=UPI000F4F553A|nr:ROK family protein [Bacillus sp. FJAT-42376]AZB43745.1 ROK family protein [Bacillus sp. FJAT-42376]